jgi:hypothetical protein
VESSRVNFGLKSTNQDSIPKYLGANFGIKAIMIGCVFIQINELMSEGLNPFILLKRFVQLTLGLGT